MEWVGGQTELLVVCRSVPAKKSRDGGRISVTFRREMGRILSSLTAHVLSLLLLESPGLENKERTSTKEITIVWKKKMVSHPISLHSSHSPSNPTIARPFHRRRGGLCCCVESTLLSFLSTNRQPHHQSQFGRFINTRRYIDCYTSSSTEEGIASEANNNKKILCVRTGWQL